MQWETVFRQRRFVRLGLDSFRSGRLSPQRERGARRVGGFADTARISMSTRCGPLGAVPARRLQWPHLWQLPPNGAGTLKWSMASGGRVDPPLGVKDTLVAEARVRDAVADGGHWGRECGTHPLDTGTDPWAWSLDLGVARLTDWIKPKDPLSQQDISSMRRIVDRCHRACLAIGQRPPTTNAWWGPQGRSIP